MRMSQLFSTTLRDAPNEAEITSHKLLLRAGFIRPLAAGIFSYLPLAYRAMTKIEAIIREEMDRIGGQELKMPVVHTADIWKETGRWQGIGSEMGRFQDRAGRDMVLAMTHEEVVADLARKEIKSYRQLPRLIYQIQTKWRDEPRPRAGLIRTREFAMKDSYSLDTDWEGLEVQYRAHYQAYFNIFHRCGLDVRAVKSDVGAMGGMMAHEFMYLTPIGEDTLLICDACGYAANREIATFHKITPETEMLKPVEKVETPGTTTIESLAEFLDIPASKTAKALFMVANISEGVGEIERFVLAIIRGDMELNETKLVNAVGARTLRPATEGEIRAIGAVPGYGSAVGVRGEVLVVVDDVIPQSPNLVAGANEEGYHLLNVNFERDYQAHYVTDIVAARDGDRCPECDETLRAVRGVEAGNIFKLGARYSDALGATYLDEHDQAQPIVMGSYGIGIGRALAIIAEAHHDDNGLIWPVTVAPYQVHLVVLPEGQETAETLYKDLVETAGIETLFDDRDERAGVKFNDADLIGLPLRLTVSKRSLANGGVEFKRRDSPDREIVAIADVIDRVQSELAAMHQAIADTVREMPFKA